MIFLENNDIWPCLPSQPKEKSIEFTFLKIGREKYSYQQQFSCIFPFMSIIY